MNLKTIFSSVYIVLICSQFIYSQPVSQFRGPERNGIYPETGLLKEWPADGPALSWKSEGIGNGYSSPVISEDKIFVTGEIDSMGYLSVFDKSGKFMWKKEIGSEWMENFTGSRSTPTLVGDLIYICSSMGRISCLDAANGKERWSIDMVKDLNGINVRFGYSEGLLVDGESVYCAPGGPDTNIVALNRFTGKINWKSKALGDTTAYCSPVLITLPARKLLVTFSIHDMIGLDAGTGELLWSVPQSRDADIQACTPVFREGCLYIVNGSGNGACKFELSSDGNTIRQVWCNEEVTDIHGGFILVGDYLFTSQYRPRRYCSLDCSSGQVVDSLKFDKGSVITADGLLYFFTEKGKLGLVKQADGKMELVSSFKLPVGTKEYFTIPVIADGSIYLRHGDALLCYKLREE